jgi:hypothetical protein
MLSKSFEHGGAIYTLRPMTIFDEEMATAAWVDLSRALKASKGIAEADVLPYVIQRLSRKYVDWMQLTTIKPCPKYANSSVYSADVQAFEQWQAAILADGQALAIAWETAYRSINEVADDEKKENGASENGHVSEPLPTTATETSS